LNYQGVVLDIFINQIKLCVRSVLNVRALISTFSIVALLVRRLPGIFMPESGGFWVIFFAAATVA
jgi:hypothetical protein